MWVSNENLHKIKVVDLGTVVSLLPPFLQLCQLDLLILSGLLQIHVCDTSGVCILKSDQLTQMNYRKGLEINFRKQRSNKSQTIQLEI